jgi:hypothetical protein
LTKEVDWRVAKAYVALADETGEANDFGAKGKEGDFVDLGPLTLEERAIARYLDDDEWEESQKKQGVKGGITKFPFVDAWGEKSAQSEKKTSRRWWS